MRLLLEDIDTENAILKNLDSNVPDVYKQAQIDLIKYLRSTYPDKFKLMNAPGKSYLALVLGAIEDFGLTRSRNPMLDFALTATTEIPVENATILNNVFRNGTLKSNAPWLYEENACTGTPFKLKALIYLSRAKDTNAVNEVLNLKDDAEIQRYLRGWQSDASGSRGTTRSGSRRYRVAHTRRS